MQELEHFKVPQGFRGRPGWYVQLWWLVQATLFRCSPQVMYGWRRFLLRCFGAQVGKSVIIRPSAEITYPWKIELGDHCWIGDSVVLYSLGVIKIGDRSVISQRTYLCTGSHDYMSRNFDIYAQDILIGSRCWLGTDVFVAPGINVGDGSVVGARSSVFKDIGPNCVAVGSPCRVIGMRE